MVITVSEHSSEERIKAVLTRERPHLAKSYGVTKLAIFGSYAKGHPAPSSDVDILVELKEPLGLAFVQLADHLEQALGSKVDLVTFDCLGRSLENPRRRHIAQEVERSLVFV